MTPIAIVGRSCILPGAATPRALFDVVLAGQSLIKPTPPHRWPGLDPAALARSMEAGERVASVVGGYVGDIHLRLEGVAEKIDGFERLDPLFHWLAHCALDALRGTSIADGQRVGLVVGNLSYPTSLGSAFVDGYWRGENLVDPRNRFSSGLPVHLVAEAMGLTGPAFALDAACASSLYAIKCACDALHDGEADVMLSGGINRADDLFIHLGFTALQALSPSGQSRPFHRHADGLVPSEGAAMVALKRLGDAERDGDRIMGVIRAVGLCNDGRQNGFLAPSASGQVRAMEVAFEQAGLGPSEIAFVDCHATGTARGDATELESLVSAYGDTPLVLGALKAILGHTITASGAASLINVLSAFETDIMPPTPCDRPLEALKETSFKLPCAPTPWAGRVKRAAVSNFGFGGNNAHLIVEAYARARRKSARRKSEASVEDVAICSVGVVTGGTRGLDAFRRRAFGLPSTPAPLDHVELTLAGLGFPPSDLSASLAQQTAMLEAVAQALAAPSSLPRDRTGVIIGMGCDATIARHGVRVRAGGDAAWLAANAAAAPSLTAESVLGTMPNIPANRVHAQRDFRGFGFTVSSEELSGIAALALGARALRAGELDAVIVGAVDMCCEPANAAALTAIFPELVVTPGDAAVALVLKRSEDAKAAGDRVIAVLPGIPVPDLGETDTDTTASRFGHTHAARGLLQVLGDALAIEARVRIDAGGAQPALTSLHSSRRHTSFSGRAATVALSVREGDPAPTSLAPVPMMQRFAAGTVAELKERMKDNASGGHGDVRCAFVAESEIALDALRARAAATLHATGSLNLPGVAFASDAMEGELAFTFTGAAAAYAGAGRDLLLAWPELGDALAERHAGAGELARALYSADVSVLDPRVQLTGCALVCQAHAEFSRSVLKLVPQAAIGLSSGETNALLAFGVWRDLDAMLGEIEASGLYGRELTGACRAAAQTWKLPVGEAVAWTCWRIAAPRELVEQALASEPRAYMTIVQAPDDCVIGGEPSACARVVDRVGRGKAMPLGLDMIVHCIAMEPFADAWRSIHTRKAYPAPTVRFYSNAFNGAYTPTSDSAAEAITRQALAPIDFPKTIHAAWDDGVRIFVEHGPRSILTGAVGRVLEGKTHLAIALDPQERRGLRALSESVMKLWAHGAPMEIDAFEARLQRLRRSQDTAPLDDTRKLILPAHPPAIVVPMPSGDRQEDGRVSEAAQVQHVKLMPMAPTGPARLRVFQTQSAVTSSANAAPPIPDRQAVALRLVAAVGETHLAFMTMQSEAHHAFLQTRAHQLAAVAGAGAAPTIGPRPMLKLEAAPVPMGVPALYNREQLETLAGGKVSDVFGPLFAQQDGYLRQVRMPQPPLLLADRVIILEGEAGAMGKGRIVTETDVDASGWYMHAGRMAPGAVIESGQADLLLASWLGADFLNRGERVYRLLGCDLTFTGELPRAGETLRYDIRIDAHANTGATRLFFFHYDCYIGDRLMISVRNGQAGFFSDSELAQSGGVLWNAAEDAPKGDARRDPPPRTTSKRSFDRLDVDAFVAGSAFSCFGDGFEMAAAHVRTPTIPGGRLRLLDEVLAFEPEGGPWKRGYLRARSSVPTDAWFYKGHFKNDPCMPGTLMADAATQALSFAMAAYGFTIDRDGWRFEPMPGEMARFVCRGQVTPEASHVLDYEVFIEEIIDGPTPTVFAALLCQSDGFKVFHCRRFGMRLVPDWPLESQHNASRSTSLKRIVGQSTDVRGDFDGLVACASGKPSVAFGALYEPFDGARRAPRLPGDPYHFVSRILSVDGAPGKPLAGAAVVAEYDAPADAWYFADAASSAVPLSVLTEVLLQPCGWLASYMGFAANRSEDVAFRNLDGTDVLLHRLAGAGTLRVTARLDRFAEAGGSTIVFFSVVCTQGGDLVMTMKTAFGFFSPEALKSQVGLPAGSEVIAAMSTASSIAVLGYEDAQELSGAPALSMGKLRLLDTITGFWPDGGAAGLGRLVARAAVDPAAWFFKAHFFQDPVQPGSLGLEALQQSLRGAVKLKGLSRGAASPVFEPVAAGIPFSWRFRGQVLPTNRQTATEIEVMSVQPDDRGVTVVADGAYWVDGLRIYEVKGMGARLNFARP